MLHLVQITDGASRRVAIVEEPHLRCLSGVDSVYALASASLANNVVLTEHARSLATGETLSYDDVYSGASPWRLLAPIDVPGEPSKTLVAGTGLTHLGSAKERQAMHLAEAPKAAEAITDSMRMFQWGVDRGRPGQGEVGIAPEWFYKGDGSVLRGPFDPLAIPPYAEDGGEEAELAGIYLVGTDGTPHRIGFAVGNEFSDHKFEKRNYLNLAGSKLRSCSLGPELVVGADFSSVTGHVSIRRGDRVLWQKDIESGEANMCHSLTNLEHHHFKFEGHRQPGTVHVHYFGADSLSFGEGIELENGDIVEVSYNGFGRPLRNVIHRDRSASDKLVRVAAMA
jgi:hypothetical protein